MTVGQIIIVEGKADTNSNPPKILVDTIRTEIKILEPLEATTPAQPDADPFFDVPFEPTSNGGMVTDVNYRSTQPAPISMPQQNTPVKPAPQTKPSTPLPPRQVKEKSAPVYAPKPVEEVSWEDSDVPPPPDNFPDDWATQWQPSFEEAFIAARPEPRVDTTPVNAPRPQPTEAVKAQVENLETETAEAAREAVAVQAFRVEPSQIPPSLYVPLAKEEKDKDHPPKQITMILRSTGDKDHDRRRIKTIYGTLISFHGRDRFSFQIFENGSGYLIDFPNDSTRVCNEMLERLKKLMGEENWRVEEITFQ
jgi:hypothetical protein